MYSIYDLAFTFLIISLIFLEVKKTQFINILKNKQPAAWEHIGKPSGYFLSYLFRIEGFKFEWFILKKKYVALDDIEIKVIGDKVFIALLLFLCFSSIFFMILIVKLFTYNS